MQTNTAKEGNTLTIEVTGRLDTTTSPQLEEVLTEQLTDDVRRLIMDFAQLEYISSAGLRVLLSAHKQMSGRDGMTVRNVNDVVEEVFDVTGFLDVLDVEKGETV